MLKLIKYLKKYKLETWLSPLFKLIEASFELLVPIVVASIIDVGIARADTAFILSRGLIRSYIFYYRAVLCSQGIGGLRYGIKKCHI